MNREKAIKILIAKLTDQQLFDDVLQPELVKAMEYAASFMEAIWKELYKGKGPAVVLD